MRAMESPKPLRGRRVLQGECPAGSFVACRARAEVLMLRDLRAVQSDRLGDRRHIDGWQLTDHLLAAVGLASAIS